GEAQNVREVLKLTFSNFTTVVAPLAPGTFLSSVASAAVAPPDETGAIQLFAYGLQGSYDSVSFYLDSDGDGVLETTGANHDQLLGTSTDIYGSPLDLPYDQAQGAFIAQDGSSTPVHFSSAANAMIAVAMEDNSPGLPSDPAQVAMTPDPMRGVKLPPVK